MTMRRALPIQVLLVEDNPGDVRLTMEALKDGKVRCDITVARDGVEALEYLRGDGASAGRALPDVILLDLNLPRKGGLETLEEIRRDEAMQHIPVVILTSSSAESDVARSYALAANAYVTKPVGLAEFLVVVKSIEHFWFEIVRLP
jgi:two-component system, chemotaxis family, response regulator Rcp1